MSIPDHIQQAFEDCATIRQAKAEQYGNAWQVASYKTILFIILGKMYHAQEMRISGNTHKLQTDLKAIHNYALFAHHQLHHHSTEIDELNRYRDEDTQAVDELQASCKALLKEKNNGYASAWLQYSKNAFLEIIHIKIARIVHLDNAEEVDLLPIEDALKDIANYAILALVKLRLQEEDKQKDKATATQ